MAGVRTVNFRMINWGILILSRQGKGTGGSSSFRKHTQLGAAGTEFLLFFIYLVLEQGSR